MMYVCDSSALENVNEEILHRPLFSWRVCIFTCSCSSI
jgi:hypothetical protein